jgi:hypothetical protein
MIKNSAVAIENHKIKLHTNDHREKIMNEFNQVWKSYQDRSSVKIFNDNSIKKVV